MLTCKVLPDWGGLDLRSTWRLRPQLPPPMKLLKRLNVEYGLGRRDAHDQTETVILFSKFCRCSNCLDTSSFLYNQTSVVHIKQDLITLSAISRIKCLEITQNVAYLNFYAKNNFFFFIFRFLVQMLTNLSKSKCKQM